MTTREELLSLQPGTPTWLNGVPVNRLPCDGIWFDVGVHEDYPCITYQRLNLSDALSRVRSGYFIRLPNAPDLNSYYARCREEQRIALNREFDAWLEAEERGRT